MNLHPTQAGGALAGLLVLDLSHALAGPHATMMLGDLGARVIKVEGPQGDETRGWGPPFAAATVPGAPPESTYFLACNRNKEPVVADLKDRAGPELVEGLIRRADVLVENFRPGVLDRLGFGSARLRELNPRLVVLSISGFGHDGPGADRPGYDQIAQGEAGLMSLTGEPGRPTKTGVPVADLLAGIFGVCGVLAALIERGNGGYGQTVRSSLLSALIGFGPSRTCASHPLNPPFCDPLEPRARRHSARRIRYPLEARRTGIRAKLAGSATNAASADGRDLPASTSPRPLATRMAEPGSPD